MNAVDDDLSEFLLIRLEFILKPNFFVLKGSIFLQLRGTAMGATCVPSYANVFLGLWEREISLTHQCPFMDMIYWWYSFHLAGFRKRPDWIHEYVEYQLKKSQVKNIKLTLTYSDSSVEFLDTRISRDSDGWLQSDLHRKDTAVNSDHVVYIIHCKICNLDYVGCTIRKLKLRVAEHLSAINKSHIHHSGAAAHFT